MICCFFDVDVVEDVSLTTEVDVQSFSLYLTL